MIGAVKIEHAQALLGKAMLKLRHFENQDLELLVEYLNCDDVVRYLSTVIPQPYTDADAKWWICEGSKADFVRAIEVNGVLAGCIGAHRKQAEFSKSAEVGYWLAKPFWGQGFATEALNLLAREVSETTDIVRLQAMVFEGNAASLAVLKKSGFTAEGYLQKAVYKNRRFYNAHLLGKVVS
ncbi:MULTISPECIES: GNAT family N-acetyltransferase [Corallincola]|nr:MULTISPECIES: GNAT family N-acetyltransferase [Corallincola]